MGTYKLKRKNFTKYDDTDEVKRMKDSDILAERKKTNPGYGGPLMAGATAALGGAVVGASGLGIAKGINAAKGTKLKSIGKGIKRGGKIGAIAAGTAGLIGALNKRQSVVDDNKFYNDRLDYAQRQAQRRERRDWKSNMTQRDGYSY